MRKIILVCFLSIYTLSQAQSISNVKTEYSRIEKGSIGKESYTFSFYNSYINITDNDYNSKEKYGPLVLYKSGYEDGIYFMALKLDVEKIKKNPALAGYYRNIKNKRYSFVFNTKGGDLLYIKEFEIRNKKLNAKTFYTKTGYQNINSSTSKKSDETTDLDFKNLILNSSSLSNLMGRINFIFEQKGNKKTSKDGMYKTVNYEKFSNAGNLIRALIVYDQNGEVDNIKFLLSENESKKVINELISQYPSKKIDGQDAIFKEKTTYLYKVEDGIGIITILE
jgi:hypothetical protein